MNTLARRHQAELLLVVSTLALFLFYYFGRADLIGAGRTTGDWFTVTGPALSPTRHFVLAAALLGALPVVVARWGCSIPLRELGLGLGRWTEGLVWVAVGVPIAVLAGWIASGSPDMRAVYPLDPSLGAELGVFLPHALRNLLYFGAWEVMFRGVLLFGLRARTGDGTANATQTGLSVVAHFGRPMTETFSAIPAGLAFGWITMRIQSIWYVAIIHWVVGTSMDWFIVTG
ncbi:MAG: CPBP family intramembrane glutamic endopeptidase [Gemmatimonadota bacterium]